MQLRNVWRMGSWNVWWMVDTEGPIVVARQGTERGEDKKVDLVAMLVSSHSTMWWLGHFRRPNGLAVIHTRLVEVWF